MDRKAARRELGGLLNGVLLTLIWVSLVGFFDDYLIPSLWVGGVFIVCYYTAIKAALGFPIIKELK